MQRARQWFVIGVAIVGFVVAGCGVSRSVGGETAATVNAGGNTYEVSSEQLGSIVQQIADNPEATSLVFNQVPDQSQVLTVLVQNELLAGAVDALDVQVSGDADAAARAEFDDFLASNFDEEQGSTIRAGLSEYLDAFFRRQALQQTLTESFADESSTIPCARHILVETEEEALAVIDRLDGGEDFATVATDVSTDPGSPGGDLGCSDPNGYVPEFRDAILAGPMNTILGPVQTQFGYHVIEVYDEAPDESATQAAAAEYFTTFRDSAAVEIAPPYGTWDPSSGQVLPSSGR